MAVVGDPRVRLPDPLPGAAARAARSPTSVGGAAIASGAINGDTVVYEVTCSNTSGLRPHHHQVRQAVTAQRDGDRQVQQHLARDRGWPEQAPGASWAHSACFRPARAASRPPLGQQASTLSSR